MAGLLEHPAAILIVVVLALVLFGSRKLPDASRNLGRSARILRSEAEKMKAESAEKNGEGFKASRIDSAESIEPAKPLHEIKEENSTLHRHASFAGTKVREARDVASTFRDAASDLKTTDKK